MQLKSLIVFGIFDHQDIEFDFSVSPFFLVGPNGTGKSTALKVLHNVLSGQWAKLRSIPFAGIVYDVGEGYVGLDKTDLIRIDRLKREILRRGRKGTRTPMLFPATWLEAHEILQNRQPSMIRRIPPLPSSVMDLLSQNYENIAPLANVVENSTLGKVLYFPTYRRVERDLGELLSEDDERDGDSIFPEVVDRFKSAGEVVGFGGQDIALLLENATDRVNEAARKALNEHSVRFLQVIATKDKPDLRPVKLLVKSADRVDHLLARISAFAPLSIDLISVKSALEQIRQKLESRQTGRRVQHEETLLVYLSALMTLFEKIDELANDLRVFSALIESYLGPLKHAKLQELDNRIVITDANDNKLEPDQLSSGEKQILAFFAFLLLKVDVRWKYIIIDEPELSLSVSWQKTLIKDILKSRPGTVLVAATHSPFIFEDFPLDHVATLGTL